MPLCMWVLFFCAFDAFEDRWYPGLALMDFAYPAPDQSINFLDAEHALDCLIDGRFQLSEYHEYATVGVLAS